MNEAKEPYGSEARPQYTRASIRSLLLLTSCCLLWAGVIASPLKAEPLRGAAHNIAEDCEYLLTAATVTIQEARSFPLPWHRLHDPVVALGEHQGAVWLRCRVLNESHIEDWVITSRYPFSSRIELYMPTGDASYNVSATGSLLPAAERALSTREDCLPVKFPAGKQSQFFIKYQSPYTKVFYLQAIPRTHLLRTEQNETYGFIAYVAILALIFLVNVFLAIRTAHLLPLYYIAALVLSFAYQTFEFGIGLPSLFPASKGAYLLMGFGGLALCAYAFFLRELVSLKITIPRLNRFIRILTALLAAYALSCFFELGGVMLLQICGRALYFTLTIAVLYGVLRVYFLGFRPALYSGYGLIVLFGAQTMYLLNMSGITHLDGYLAKFLLPVGQLVEFGFFFRSVLLRVTDQEDLLKVYRIESAVTRKEMAKIPAKMRLSEAESEAALSNVIRLFEEEKVYRSDDLTLPALAEKAGMTRHELSELLNIKLNKTFYELLNEFRIREAERIIVQEPGQRVLDVALAVGFNSKSTFNKEFKRLTGKTPTEAKSRT